VDKNVTSHQRSRSLPLCFARKKGPSGRRKEKGLKPNIMISSSTLHSKLAVDAFSKFPREDLREFEDTDLRHTIESFERNKKKQSVLILLVLE
jgi:hypothetical protein